MVESFEAKLSPSILSTKKLSTNREKTDIIDFEQKIELIQQNFEIGAYTIAAKECVGLIEQALRQLFKDQLTRLKEEDRLRVQDVERKKGRGLHGVERFTMGQLINLFRASQFLEAWERASGKDLGNIRMINLDELTRFRNNLIHNGAEATRFEAEFLLNCLRVILETFELADSNTSDESPEQAIESEKAVPERARTSQNAAAHVILQTGPTSGTMIDRELLQLFERREVVLFVGSDLSTSSGLPSWIDIIRPLAQSLQARWPSDDLDVTPDHLLSVAQYYENQQGRNALINHLRLSLDAFGIQPSAISQLVSALPVKIIFTSNYDGLLEQALRQAGLPFDVIVDESEMAFWSEDRVQVVKLCGDLSRPQSLVVTKNDFNTYLTTHPRIAERLRGTLEIKTPLFLAYSLHDPFFNYIWDNIGLSFGALRRRGYAALFERDPLELENFQRRGIHVIQLAERHREKSAAIEQWLTALCHLLSPGKKAIPGKGERQLSHDEVPYGTGKRWAVLSGVNSYDDRHNYGRLQVCAHDVTDIRRQLIEGGFESARIRLLTDESDELPTRENILVALKSVADATEPDDLLLFYYSGHGDEQNHESYLVTRNGRRLLLGDTALSLSRVKEILEQAPARAKVIIIDACHSGADIGGKGPRAMTAAFIRRVFEQAEGFAVLASCKQGQLSYEWREENRSVFTHFLLEALAGQADYDAKGFVTIQDANRHIVNNVKLWASQHNVSQTPTLQYTAAGDIILCRQKISD